jgi:glutamate dehydrogenase/leucine dehydrogenase
VAQFTSEKINQLGGRVVTLSDSAGFIHDPEGIDAEKYECQYHEVERPWSIKGEAAFPSATENEINEEDAKKLVSKGCMVISEGANMPSTLEAIGVYEQHKILYGPGKAANAGGVAVSGLETTQNSMRLPWTREEVDNRLHTIMKSIQFSIKANSFNTTKVFLLSL